MSIMDDIEKFAVLLPPASERIPRVLKVRPDIYFRIYEEQRRSPQSYNPNPPVSTFEVTIVIDDELEDPRILYDQHKEEMKRAG